MVPDMRAQRENRTIIKLINTTIGTITSISGVMVVGFASAFQVEVEALECLVSRACRALRAGCHWRLQADSVCPSQWALFETVERVLWATPGVRLGA